MIVALLEKFWFRLIIASLLLSLSLLLRSHWWQKEYQTRFERLHDAIRPGMTVDQIENLLIHTNLFVSFQIETNGVWVNADRTEFLQVLGNAYNPATNQLKMGILNLPPGKAFEFDVLFNATGGASRISPLQKK